MVKAGKNSQDFLDTNLKPQKAASTDQRLRCLDKQYWKIPREVG